MMAKAERETETFWDRWRHRLHAIRNIPPVLRIVWQSGPKVVSGGLILRLAAALLPLAILLISRQIIDGAVPATKGGPLPSNFWLLVGSEFGLAVLGTLVGRSIWFCDTLLADRFTRHVSVKVMEHASRLDLQSYEDPVFYDKLERARAQATDRISMVQAIGSILQQVVVAVSLSSS